MPGRLPLYPGRVPGQPLPSPSRRRVRSYVLRGGRTTRAQQRAIRDYWSFWGIQPDRLSDLDSLFGRRAPCVLEVGFGNGESLLSMAQAMPGINFIGADVYPAGIGRLLQGIAHHELKNIRIWQGDAQSMLKTDLAPRTLDAVQVFFPDPWPKRRHHKRRLVRAEFLQLCASRLRPRGLVHLVTDWESYAREMLAAAEKEKCWENIAGRGHFSPRAPWRPVTCFEKRAGREGRAVFELLFLCRDG